MINLFFNSYHDIVESYIYVFAITLAALLYARFINMAAVKSAIIIVIFNFVIIISFFFVEYIGKNEIRTQIHSFMKGNPNNYLVIVDGHVQDDKGVIASFMKIETPYTRRDLSLRKEGKKVVVRNGNELMKFTVSKFHNENDKYWVFYYKPGTSYRYEGTIRYSGDL